MTELETASAARIAELEMVIESLSARVQEVGAIGRREHVKVLELEAELAAMRAGGEPVAVVGNDFTLFWAGIGPIAPIIEKHGIKVGSPLYTHPQPAAQDAERKPLTDEQAHQLLLEMEAYINTFDEDSVTAVQLSGEAVRFIVGKVAAIAAQGDSHE